MKISAGKLRTVNDATQLMSFIAADELVEKNASQQTEVEDLFSIPDIGQEDQEDKDKEKSKVNEVSKHTEKAANSLYSFFHSKNIEPEFDEIKKEIQEQHGVKSGKTSSS